MSKIDASRTAEENAANSARHHLETYLAKKNKATTQQKNLEHKLPPIQQELANLADFVPNILKHIASEAEKHGPIALMGTMGGFVEDWWTGLPVDKQKHLKLGGTRQDGAGVHFIEWLFKDGFDIQIKPETKEDVKAILVLEKLVQFVIELQLGTAALAWLLKLFFCDRMPESFIEVISGLSEEIGLNWMLGNIFEAVFEQAVGKPLEEMINRTVRPNRVDVSLVKKMLQQHVLEEADAKKYLQNEGYLDEDIAHIVKLDKHSLGMGDLQTAFLTGAMKQDGIKKYLGTLGYDSDDIDILVNNYITHAETQGNTIYRSAARAAFKNDTITEDHFKSILEAINTPEESIPNEVAAIKLEKETRHREVSTGILKELWLNHPEMRSALSTELNKMGFSDDEVTQLTTAWADANRKHHKGLPPGRIATYVASGVITKQDGHDRLVAMDYSDADAWLIVNNPRVASIHHALPYNRSTILSAYKDGIILAGEAEQRLAAINVPNTEINGLMSVASYEMERAKTRSVHKKHLNEAQIHDALKYKLHDWGWALDRFGDLGYSEDQAMLLTAILLAKLGEPGGDTGSQENPPSPISTIPIPPFGGLPTPTPIDPGRHPVIPPPTPMPPLNP